MKGLLTSVLGFLLIFPVFAVEYEIRVNPGETHIITIIGEEVEPPTIPTDPHTEVILDNLSSEVTIVGSWLSSASPGFYQSNSVYSENTSGRFTWNFNATGEYDVYAWWTHHVNRASSVPYTVTHLDGSTTITVDQSNPSLGGQWIFLGRFTDVDSVMVSGENGQANADAVKITPAEGEVPTPPDDDTSIPGAGTTYADCLSILNGAGGGWCEITSSRISDVYPDPTPPGIVGPDSVLEAWNGSAWDSAARCMYFFGGGHADYGGNEVYSYCLATSTFVRLTEPSTVSGFGCDLTYLVGPRPVHTYDGIIFSNVTRTIWVFPGATGYCDPGMKSTFPQVWEFNPSGTETRHGVAPLTWRLSPIPAPQGAYPMTAERPDGKIDVWQPTKGATFDPSTETWEVRPGNRADWGDGNLVWDEINQTYWSTVGGIWKNWETNFGEHPFGSSRGAGIATRSDGMVYIWEGRTNVLRLDPTTNTFKVAVYSNGPSGVKVYSKWIYLPEDDVFLGISESDEGMWIFRPEVEGWSDVQLQSIQPIINAATPGSEVTIPPGYYRNGFRVEKPLTVNLAGVTLGSSIGSKGFIIVDNTIGPVVLNDFTSTLAPKAASNVSCVRIDGKNFNVTINRMRCEHGEMGVLTGNLGGRLEINDSFLGYTADGSDLSHIIYVGLIDEFLLRRSTVTGSFRDGHLVKSRAKKTLIEENYILGNPGWYSREFDLAEGGDITIRRNVIQKGPKTDNAEMIAIRTECGPGASHPDQRARDCHPTDVKITNNWIIFDRKAGFGDRYHTDPNWFGKFRYPNEGSISVMGNKIINLGIWGEIPNFTNQNEMFPTRAAAGLGPFMTDLPVIPN